MPSTELRKQLMSHVRNLVVKVGTALLTGDDGKLDRALIDRLARQLAALHAGGTRVTLVTSGAVGAGIGLAGLPGRPRQLPLVQATAAIGQPALMSLYARTLARFNLHAGQVLVTRADFEERNRYVNICNTIEALQRLNAIPIINENDTVAVDELDRFADNDTIAALLTNLLRADLLVLLTVVDGLLDTEGQLVDLVTHIGDVQGMVRIERSKLGSGGMMSKVGATRFVTDAGVPAVVANGRMPNVLARILEGERVGTIFAPAPRKMPGRRRWIMSAARPNGAIRVDAGAARALVGNGKSLLPSGIVEVTGDFARGDVVRVLGPESHSLGQGIVNYSRGELDRIKGLKTGQIAAALGSKPYDEAIHRDNLVITASAP
jgi:glutamate 5-kinase